MWSNLTEVSGGSRTRKTETVTQPRETRAPFHKVDDLISVHTHGDISDSSMTQDGTREERGRI